MEVSYFDLLNASTQGAYRVNTFLTRIGTDGDLDPEFGDPFPSAISLHVHEYIHSLHNVSTDVGFELIFTSLVTLPYFVTKTDENGHFHADRDSLGMEELFDFWSTIIKMLRGSNCKLPEPPPENPDSWAFSAVSTVDVSAGLATGMLKTTTVHGIELTVGKQNRDYCISIENIGFDLITEGVAYEVDREVRRNNGCPEGQLDAGMPLHPYLTYRKVVDHLVGRNTSPEERIKVGVCALLTAAPSRGFVEACSAMRSNKFTEFERSTFSAFRISVAEKISRLRSLVQFFPGDDVVSRGFALVLDLVCRGLNVRMVRPYLELEFLDKKIDSAVFHSIVAKMQDHCVLQEKSGGGFDLYWGGSHMANVDEENLQCLGAFQSALYFSQLHFDSEARLHSTDKLPISKCPFSGACAVEQTLPDSSLCSVAPWKISIGGENSQLSNMACWYGVGVKSLARKEFEDTRELSQG